MKVTCFSPLPMKCSWLLIMLAGSLLAQTTTTIKTTSPSDGAALGPTPATTQTSSVQTPNGVELEIGIVSRIGGPSVSNYQLNNGILSVKNLGRATPELLTGLGFSCETATSKSTITSKTDTATTETTTTQDGDQTPFCNTKFVRHLGAFVAAQFGSGSNDTISGYSVGMTYAPYKHLRILMGFSMSPVSEISPGFANAAAQYVTANSKLFPGIIPANLASRDYGAFDGIQVTNSAPASGAAATSNIYYAGSPTTTHYRGGFIIGVAVPVNIFNLLGGNGKN